MLPCSSFPRLRQRSSTARADYVAASPGQARSCSCSRRNTSLRLQRGSATSDDALAVAIGLVVEPGEDLRAPVADERCKWPNTLSCGLAGKGRLTETLVGVSPPSSKDPADPPSAEELAAAKELVRQARAQGVALTGPGGLLKALTKTVIETALEEEMAEHLGYDKHDPLGRNRGNSRNGKRAKTVLTDSGEVAVEVPRDRDGSFEPVIVAKRQRRLSSIDEIVLSLYARGLTTGDIAAHLAMRSMTPRSPRTPSPGSPTGWWRRCRPGPAGRWDGVVGCGFLVRCLR